MQTDGVYMWMGVRQGSVEATLNIFSMVKTSFGILRSDESLDRVNVLCEIFDTESLGTITDVTIANEADPDGQAFVSGLHMVDDRGEGGLGSLDP